MIRFASREKEKLCKTIKYWCNEREKTFLTYVKTVKNVHITTAMTHQNHQTNGASLEDCHTNFFALVSNFHVFFDRHLCFSGVLCIYFLFPALCEHRALSLSVDISRFYFPFGSVQKSFVVQLHSHG